MIYISHRGNINGKNTERENSPEYILEALDKGYNVEVDVWFVDNKWYFGHDEPKYEIDLYNFTLNLNYKLWLHCKNDKALFEIKFQWHHYNSYFFWHQNDSFAFVLKNNTNKFIWTYPGKELMCYSICVLPEIPISNLHHRYTEDDFNNCAGICSDYIEEYNLHS